MMDYPLTVTHFLQRAATYFGDKEVVSAGAEGSVRLRWRDVATRAAFAAEALRALGVGPGDRVATLAWNTHRHLELYFGVPAMGAVLHTVNLRLSERQVAEIVAHGGAKVLLADADQAAVADVERLRRAGVEHFIALCGGGRGPSGGEPALAEGERAGAAAERAPRGWLAYEDLLADAAPRSGWPELDEDLPAGLCYTSGTTGEPKGVAYSHRALALHTLAVCLPDGFGLSEADAILPAVPMFHANAWGLTHAAAMTGARLVLPGVHPDARRFADLLSEEQVTFAAGVPTVWMEVLAELRARPRALHPRLRIHAGGAPSPPSLIEAYARELGIEILTGWGMTELTPVGMVTHPRAAMEGWSDGALMPIRTSQGTPLPFVEARLVDDEGAPVPADGASPGELEVRGPWVTAGYHRREAPESFDRGWLRTGDVATCDPDGYYRIVDRTKDLIRSGGEWISSVRLEHALMALPGVAEAVVVAVPHPKWQERPWAFVVRKESVVRGEERAEAVAELLAPLADTFPRWWIPDRVLFVDAIPRTATGKFDKRALRERARELAAPNGGPSVPTTVDGPSD